MNILIICLCLLIGRQIPQDTNQSNYAVYYEVDFVSDSTALDVVSTDVMVLFVGNNQSKFRNYYQMQRDSIVEAAKQNPNPNPSVILGQVNQIQKPKFKYTIVKDWTSRTYKYYDRIIPDNFVFEGELGTENWEIMDEFDDYEGIKIQKAVTTYSGRTFVAWFSTEIPINDGPYIFGNLPGLIVKVSDTNNHYSFRMVGITQLNENLDHFVSPSPIKVSKRKFFQLEHEYNANVLERLASGGITVVDPNQAKEVQNRFQKKNNPLELKVGQ